MSALVLFNIIGFLLAGRIKRVCETELGIVSQCCLPKHASSHNMQYFENVALKINVKVWFAPIFLCVHYHG